MGMISLFADGAALMIGSLLAAILLTLAAWAAGQRLRRPWAALVLLGLTVCGLLLSPLEQSLFVRMVSVFAIVGGLLLSFEVLDRDVKQESSALMRHRRGRGPLRHGRMPPRP